MAKKRRRLVYRLKPGEKAEFRGPVVTIQAKAGDVEVVVKFPKTPLAETSQDRR